METNKKQRYLVLLVAFSMLLTFLPNFGIENVNAQSTTNNNAKYTEQKCYDGMCFEGEVEGNSLISYNKLIKDLGITEGTEPNIDRPGYEEIYDKYEQEKAKGGIWLKFTDNKYTRNGKSRTFYVMKKPSRQGVSWNTLYTAGAVYGWDVIDPNTGLPKSNPEKYNYAINKDYKAKIIEIGGNKYIVRLLQGKTNYGGNVSDSKYWSPDNENKNSEWNRTVLPLTKGYRFGSDTNNNDYLEKELRDDIGDNRNGGYVKNNYKNQTAQYNWFGDLTLGSFNNWKYNNKDYKGLGINHKGQYSWIQEFVGGANSHGLRGRNFVSAGASGTYDSNSDKVGNHIGVRLVLEPLEGTPGEVVNVTQTLNITKTNPKGEPLKDVQFTINNHIYKTDSSGKVSIPIYRYSTGILTLKEQEYKDINGINYKPKNIPINHVKQCYDGMCFEGEVEGNNLISYDKLITELGITSGSRPSINQGIIDKYPGAKEINDQYQYELSKGGMWLKFTDNKYKDKNGKPRIFYVAKKPIRKNISWNDIFDAGAVYGWDVIDPKTGKPRQNPEKYKNGSKNYQGKIITINGEKYIVRLLQGKTNYGRDVTNKTTYKYDRENANSEWNRTILPITRDYRFGISTKTNNYLERVLRGGNENGGYVTNNYENQTAQYNWLGDLTLGAYYKFVYNGKEIDNSDNGTGSNGQWNWTQEYASPAGYRSLRGYSSPNYGAADSGYYSAGNRDHDYGFRPVLEPLNN